MNTKKINVIYYVDVDDNTKWCLCAIPSDKDMRCSSIVTKVANKIIEAFGSFHALIVEHSEDIAKAITHHGFSNLGEYEFGIEEIELIEC